jgi:hypothetical protein
MWNIDPKDKCIHKYKHDYIYQINVFAIVGLFDQKREEGEEKKMIESE